jgi:hypothetical protein
VERALDLCLHALNLRLLLLQNLVQDPSGGRREKDQAGSSDMKTRTSNSEEKSRQRNVSPYLAANSSRCGFGRARLSPKENSQSRSKKRTLRTADPAEGALAEEMTNPASPVMLSIRPSTRVRVPVEEMSNAKTGICSENNLLSKSSPSLKSKPSRHYFTAERN